ncbi:MAG: aromatic ring-hydroxylating dioxygenase subunit alpha [Caulobacterales bacterium]|nr:aromatic ring-hydroxylating dioxygenase subunit alpha [Caulobacterales bacterium]
MTYAEQIKSVKDYIRLPFAYNHWYVAGLAEEFGQSPKAKTLLERSIVFYRTQAGELTAFQNRCLHRSFPLSEGYREGDLLVCRYHGIRYGPDGSIARIPCQERSSERKLRKYPIKEMGPLVFIWMGEPDHPDRERKTPDLPFLTDPSYRTIYDSIPMKGNYLLMQENLNDLTHFAYLHKDTFAFGDFFLDLPTEITQTPEGVRCDRVDTHPERAIVVLPPDIQAKARGRPVERWDGGVAVSPGVFKGYAPIHVGEPDAPDRETYTQHVTHYLTPETKTSTHYYWSMSNDFALDDDMYYTKLKPHLSAGFDEDKWACEHMQTLLDNDQIDFDEMIIAGDKAGLLFRRVMLKWVQEEHGEGPADVAG